MVYPFSPNQYDINLPPVKITPRVLQWQKVSLSPCVKIKWLDKSGVWSRGRPRRIKQDASAVLSLEAAGWIVVAVADSQHACEVIVPQSPNKRRTFFHPKTGCSRRYFCKSSFGQCSLPPLNRFASVSSVDDIVRPCLSDI